MFGCTACSRRSCRARMQWLCISDLHFTCCPETFTNSGSVKLPIPLTSRKIRTRVISNMARERQYKKVGSRPHSAQAQNQEVADSQAHSCRVHPRPSQCPVHSPPQARDLQARDSPVHDCPGHTQASPGLPRNISVSISATMGGDLIGGDIMARPTEGQPNHVPGFFRLYG